jgi:nucleotidyltransferase/DNA polymerase involved in DNA repair
MTVENKRILDEIQKKPCLGRVSVNIPQDSRRGIPERKTVLQLRYAAFTIKKPYILRSVKTLPEWIEVNVVYVKEEHPPKGKKLIEWLWKLRFRDDQ